MIHDIRRTFRTGLSRLGIDTETAERAIGPARAELLQIYDRDGAEDKLRAAFEAWATHVAKIVADEERRRLAEAVEAGIRLMERMRPNCAQQKNYSKTGVPRSPCTSIT
ncbi:hypothetical protein [uncultured Aureimonas sp.]|uniref:hypothetical protein n=1 Tax=uncultured Aureimonas sp. TaxID=1604662 RepID=UPI0025CD9239|nr:hypothetical protein [uncultured Aureimonas sp.]